MTLLKYGDKVKITSGFYIGKTGKLHYGSGSKFWIFDTRSYVVKLNLGGGEYGAEQFKHSELQKIKGKRCTQ